MKQSYPLQTIKTKPHSKTIFQEEIVNHQTIIRGNVLYALDFNRNLIQDPRMEYHFDGGPITSSYVLRGVLDTIRKNNSIGNETDMFSPFSDDLLVYKDNQYFYNFSLV